MKLGVYSGRPGQPTAMEDAAVLDALIKRIGRVPNYLMDYSNLTDPLLTDARAANCRSHGVIPIITWQLYKSGYGGDAISLSAIAGGQYNDHLSRAAEVAEDYGSEILIRFAHEMNGDWYPWGTQPTTYKAAWQQVVSRVRAGTNNVRFVWCPNVANGDAYPIAPYWPGEPYVDWMALDGYNWGTGQSWSRWQTFRTVFMDSYKTLCKLSAQPIMIGETSCSEQGGSKARWIRTAFSPTRLEAFPRVRCITWYDRPQEDDWRIESSAGSLNAFREVT